MVISIKVASGHMILFFYQDFAAKVLRYEQREGAVNVCWINTWQYTEVQTWQFSRSDPVEILQFIFGNHDLMSFSLTLETKNFILING